MSPIKRSLSDRYGDDALLSPKRLRGGGFSQEDGEEAFAPEDDLFDDDLLMPSSTHDDEFIPPEALEEVQKKISAKDQQRWKRPDLADGSNARDIHMQWIDMDVTTAPQPLARNPNAAKRDLLGSPHGPVPVLRCYGVDEKGHSVAAFIHGFTPYAYFSIPYANASELRLDDAALAEIRTTLDARLREMAARVVSAASDSPLVLGVQFIANHQSIFGFETPHTQFLKVYVAVPALVPPLKRCMEEGIALAPISPHMESYAPFECNVPFVLRFMVDRNISGAGWLTLPSCTYAIRADTAKETHCQVRCIDFSLCWS
jgi:DNA polymerase delta subunit 1